MTSGWTLSTEFQQADQITKSREATEDTPRLAPKPLTILMDSGASRRYFHDELHSGPNDRNC